MYLPSTHNLFPHRTRTAIVIFWARYWFWFFLWLPWLLVRQLIEMIANTLALASTWNRIVPVGDFGLTLIFLNAWRALPASIIWGERFLCVWYRDILIDPGPVCMRRAALGALRRLGPGRIHAVIVTHYHEEHIGNACAVARALEVPIYGSALTLKALRRPEPLSRARRTLMGEAQPVQDVELRELGTMLLTPGATLRVIDSPGHCEGHVSLYDPQEKLLIAGDSFLHTVFTSPNRDVRIDRWLQTLDRHARLPIETMVSGHGIVHTRRFNVPTIAFVAAQADPECLLREQRRFMAWARVAIQEGEHRGLPYSVIEASLFPWGQPWTRMTWFKDESIRLFSCGEFSRTHFVRSLSNHPQQVPPRFSVLSRVAARLRA